MNTSTPPPTSYPPPPWRSRGTLWAGLLTAESPLALPTGLHPLLGADRLALVLIRYLRGTLRYDEFILGSPVRRGVRPGLYVHRIWVNDAASMWGGRHIWGVPKVLAEFAWTQHGVVLTGPNDEVVDLALPQHTPPWLPLPLAAPAFGRVDGQLRHFTGWLCGRVCLGTVHLRRWPAEFPQLVGHATRPGFHVDRFRMVVRAPHNSPAERKE